MKVLVIPEDFRQDQYILKPIFSRLFNSLGIRNSQVRICQDPRLGGVVEALKPDRIEKIVERYPMVDIFVLCVDRDRKQGRRQRLDQIETLIEKEGTRFLAVNAWEEIETWVLAGLSLPTEWKWLEVRAEL